MVCKRLAIRNLFSTSEDFVQHVTGSSCSDPILAANSVASYSHIRTALVFVTVPRADDGHYPSMTANIHNYMFSYVYFYVHILHFY